jgi:micrococcal nuclease
VAGALFDVVDVVDGDTVKVRLANSQVETVRLIGIDTPEVVDPRTPVQCFGREASARAKELLSGQRVRVEQDPTQDTRDRYGRLLAYIWLEDGTLVNKQMIADGYAVEYTYDRPYQYQADFKAAQQQARDAQRGLWAPDTCNGDITQPARNVVTPTTRPAPNAPAAPPSATPGSTGAPGTGAVQIVSALGARPGGTASITAKAPPGASCSIAYTTPAGTPSTAQGLVPKTADSAGNVSWTWSIGTATRPGTGTVAVSCNGATARSSITIG